MAATDSIPNGSRHPSHQRVHGTRQPPSRLNYAALRVNQGLFICRVCGVVAHADRNASHNIAARGAAVWTAGRESRVPATP
ncbi:zinc ribbon domain-containing protein [Streptomyces sp. NBC_00120]|uniref:zinc ribbon domain-containing protein n=1 Tax=Streptomyces sp. NBC_00120 TaxID=2975660 RepID=UPI00224C9E8A|nr:zinc ribbon domain-containing protein [Streptomyces sp. NBC_00120]MCX5319905.1 transposase [Streptomyces sp. NBC_00120]